MDYYKILELDRNASDSEIKKKYRELCKKYHPDKGGDENKFKEINEAYSVLSDSDSKNKYDRYGSATSNGHGGFNMDDLFGDFFGNYGSSNNHTKYQRRKVGRSIQTIIKININDILFGTKKVIEYFREDKCKPCNGEGGTGKKQCSSCNGRGQKTQRINTPIGIMETMTTCDVCDGEGQMILNNCNTCNGSGTTKGKHKLDINIPSGALNNMQMEIPLGGNYVRNGDYGSLIVIIEEIQDSKVIRDNFDIIIKADISISKAVLGGEITVDTPHGDFKINIEPGTQGGRQYEYSNKGVPELGSNGRIYNTGDMIIITEIIIPTKISNEQRELFEKIREIENE